MLYETADDSGWRAMKIRAWLNVWQWLSIQYTPSTCIQYAHEQQKHMFDQRKGGVTSLFSLVTLIYRDKWHENDKK